MFAKSAQGAGGVHGVEVEKKGGKRMKEEEEEGEEDEENHNVGMRPHVAAAQEKKKRCWHLS